MIVVRSGNRIIAQHTGNTEAEIEKDADRDHWMSAEEATAYGIVDKVLENKKDLTPEPTPSSSSAAGPADDDDAGPGDASPA